MLINKDGEGQEEEREEQQCCIMGEGSTGTGERKREGKRE